jgi:hypothetical protein
MKRRVAGPLIVVLTLVAVLCMVNAQNPVPSNAKETCVVTPAEFAGWFASGTVKKDGLVNPADSVNFPVKNNLCDFYKWSWQMFLWLNSPEGGKHVFDSPIFFDVSDLENGKRQFIRHKPGRIHRFNLFRAQTNHKGKAIRVAPNKKTIETAEVGQADTNGVLFTQKGSLVYYGIHTNDVYAYFLTANESGAIKPPLTTFPDTKDQLDQITAFAKTQGVTLPDAKALVMELKTSWVEADQVYDASKYVTIMGEVPTFDKTDPTKWVPSGSKKTKLVMVGMHVVGTVKGHPEMLWATFEHTGNAPNDKYTYTDKKDQTATVNLDTSGNWLFCKTNAAGAFNTQTAKVDKDGNIVPEMTGKPMVPSDTKRAFPWGQGTTDNNTLIISLNNSVLGMIPDGDVRKNYVLIGTLWTKGGVVPGFDPSIQATDIGSVTLANATMETYVQFQLTNCFACHQAVSGNGLGLPNVQGRSAGFSHIYGDLQALPLKKPAKGG